MKYVRIEKIFLVFISILFFLTTYSLVNAQEQYSIESQREEILKNIASIERKIQQMMLDTQSDEKININDNTHKKINSSQTEKKQCLFYPDTLENFRDSFPEKNIRYDGKNKKEISEVIEAFQSARTKDSTVLEYEFPEISQNQWENMNFQQKSLFLINSERKARGLLPFEGLDSDVSSVAKEYGQYMIKNQYFGHSRMHDMATVWDRLNENKSLKNIQDWYAYGENLYANSGLSEDEIAVEAIYTWIYDDTDSWWGHREFIFSQMNNNSGSDQSEGLIGFGIGEGEFDYFDGNAKIFVMNAIDPSKESKKQSEKVSLFNECKKN